MKELVFYPLHDLRTQEFPDVVESVLDIVAKHDPAELKIEGFYNLLLAMRPMLDEFSDISESISYKEVLGDLRVQRLEAIYAIQLQVRAAQRVAIPSQEDARAKVKTWVENHLTDLSSQNLKVVNRKTDAFLREYLENPELVSAAAALGIKAIIDILSELQQRLKTVSANRTAENAPRRSVDRKENKKKLIKALGNLFRAIDLARVEHAATDYTPLINELGEMLASYHSLVRSRSTRAKTSAIKKETTAGLSTTTSPTVI